MSNSLDYSPAIKPKNNTTYDRHSGLPFEIVCLADGMEMVLVPAGRFIMGTSEDECKIIQQLMEPWALGGFVYQRIDRQWFRPETPQREVYLSPFYIDKYEVTNLMYKIFCMATSYKPPSYWPGGDIPPGTEHQPVTNISWYDAVNYAQWTGRRLPTEAEWEKAARGIDGRLYPWGNQFDHGKVYYIQPYVASDLNNALLRLELTRRENNLIVDVGSYPDGASPYGVMDMLGNVWEWCQDWYDENYYSVSPLADPPSPPNGTHRVIRGCGSHFDPERLRCAYRSCAKPTQCDDSTGFRCALAAESTLFA